MTEKKIGKIELDKDTCISAASCVALAAKTFQLDDQGKVAFVDKEHPIGDEEEMILEAARSCPVDAIKLFDEDGKQIWPLASLETSGQAKNTSQDEAGAKS